ncbi:hypothetical protein ABG067_006228 [Albugo candida]|uniref:Nuclear transport factor 2 n=1 Tax=Albugo candida TaxID=65357 RepID=A0A024GPP1_9STRA|nr:unnamed protein product [Albugo candida]|eukprot:CCI48705.1 unnamed protein product [Albugo candida]
MAAKDVATAFVQHYYTLFSTNRAELANLYQASSFLSWEGQLSQGQGEIMQKLQQLPQLRHNPSPDFDVQMSTSNTAMIIFVQGKVQIDENPQVQFTQVFQLVAIASGQYYIHNDIFRLQYG